MLGSRKQEAGSDKQEAISYKLKALIKAEVFSYHLHQIVMVRL